MRPSASFKPEIISLLSLPLCGVLCGFLSLQPASAGTERLRAAPGDGPFEDAELWIPAEAPGETNIAVFDNHSPTPATLILESDRIVDGLDVKTDKVRLDLGGFQLTTSRSGSDWPNSPLGPKQAGFMVAGNAEEVGTLEVLNGTLTTRAVLIGGSAGSKGSLVLSGPDTLWENPSSGWNAVVIGGRDGRGSLTMQEGAKAVLGQLTTNRRQGSQSTILLRGEGTTLQVKDVVSLGLSNDPMGRASVEVRDGAVFDGKDDFRIGLGSGHTTMVIDNATLKSGNRLRVGQNHGRAELTLTNGAQVEAATFQSVGSDGGSGVVRLENGSMVRADSGALHFGRGGDGDPPDEISGRLIIEGASRFELAGQLRLGEDAAHTGELEIRGADSILRTGLVRAGRATDAVGRISISDHAEMHAAGIHLGEAGESAGHLQISQARLSSSDDVSVGGSASRAGGEASLTLEQGGELILDERRKVQVWKTGRIHVEQGRIRTTDLVFDAEPGARLSLILHGTEEDTPLDVVSLLRVGQAELDITLAGNFHASPGDLITLIHFGVCEGEFVNLPEGTRLQAGPHELIISYGVDRPNAVTLRIPGEPQE